MGIVSSGKDHSPKEKPSFALHHIDVNFLVFFCIFRRKRYSPNMRTIRDVLSSVIHSTPFLESALADGILNLTALARRIRPEIEASMLRPVSIGSLVMALKRMIPELESTSSSPIVPWAISDLTVRSHLSELTLQWSDTVLAKQQELLEAIRDCAQRFVVFAQGVREVTVIMDSEIEHLAREIFTGERCLSSVSNLAAITLSHGPDLAASSAVYYETLKRLALKAINVVEVISTPTEFTVVVHHSDVDYAFTVLRGGIADRPCPV